MVGRCGGVIWVLGVDLSQFVLEDFEWLNRLGHANLRFGMPVNISDKVGYWSWERRKFHCARSG